MNSNHRALGCSFAFAAILIPWTADLTQAAELGLWTFEDYAGLSSVPHEGLIEDTSGSGRHMRSVGGQFTAEGSVPGTTALNFTGNLRDFLRFTPGFSNFSNSGLTASGSDIVFGEPDSFTLEAIVTLAHDNFYVLEGGILGKGHYEVGTSDQYSIVAINNGSNHLNTIEGFLGDGDHSSGTGPFLKPNKTNNPTGWVHVALVRDRSTENSRLYIDGTLVAAQADNNFPRLDFSSATGDFVIGQDRFISLKPYRGAIDAVRVSDVALSPGQFLVSTPGPIGNTPEPSSLLILAIGTLSFVLRRHRAVDHGVNS